MSRLILYIAASLDNFFARSDGSVDWLHGEEYFLPDEDYGYFEFYRSAGTVLMGHNTCRVVESFDIPFPCPDRSNYVFSLSAGKVLKTGWCNGPCIRIMPEIFIIRITGIPGTAPARTIFPPELLIG